MIKINLSPVRGESKTTISWESPLLTYNGQEFDLSELPDGATAEDHPILQKVSRVGNDYEITVTLNHGRDAPFATRFPEPVILENFGIVEYIFDESEESPV